MQAIQVLIVASKDLQREIVESGRVSVGEGPGQGEQTSFTDSWFTERLCLSIRSSTFSKIHGCCHPCDPRAQLPLTAKPTCPWEEAGVLPGPQGQSASASSCRVINPGDIENLLFKHRVHCKPGPSEVEGSTLENWANQKGQPGC